MEPRDIPEVMAIVGAGYRFLAERQGFSAKQLDELLDTRCSEKSIQARREKWACFVAEIPDEVVGVAALEGNSLEELWVLPEHHGAGIGSALFRHAEHIMIQAGESRLCVRTTGYATGFYEKMGALIVGTRTCQGGPLAGWMLTCLEKPLPGAAEAGRS
jgi:ribosomal protein S18 acetylase RimI-like enzyme